MKLWFLRSPLVTVVLLVLVVAMSAPAVVQAVDLLIDGDLVFTGPGQGGAKNIRTSNTEGGLRIFNGTSLGPVPSGAAIQFFGNGSNAFPGQAYIDSGAHNNASIILRTAPTSGAITERMRINAQGGITLGAGAQAAAAGNVAAGEGAVANRFGETAVANGSFAVPGDAQGSTFVLRGTVPALSVGVTELTLDGVSQRISVPVNHTMLVDLQVVYLSSSGLSTAFTCQSIIENINTVTTIPAIAPFPCLPVLGDAIALPPTITISADDATDTLVVTVSNAIISLDSYRIVAVVRTAEVGQTVITPS